MNATRITNLPWNLEVAGRLYPATGVSVAVRQIVKILACTLGNLFVLIGLLGVGAYAFVTSDYVRAQIENHANAISGHKTRSPSS